MKQLNKSSNELPQNKMVTTALLKKIYFRRELLLAMLKSIKDILVQVYFANESLEHDCFLVEPQSTHQFHEPLFP